MRNVTRERATRVVGTFLPLVAVGLAVLFGPGAAATAGPRAKPGGTWRGIAANLRTSVKADLKASYHLALARAALLPTDAARKAAQAAARADYDDEKALPNEQYAARLELAERLGETEPYGVTVDPADFVERIDNPLLPLLPGTTLTYRAEKEEGTETIVVTVLDETKVILGVTCTVVRDTVSVGGQVVEDTRDWFAQDKLGNVWYFGEISLNYEDGRLVDVEGSWEAGVDGAQPGILMKAAPAVGDLYRQEFYLGEAEDHAEVLSLTESVTVPFGSFTNCLKTAEGAPLEPDHLENKFYARGIGVVLELDPESGERVELISRTTR